MKPIVLLRIIMLCMILFFLYASVRKARLDVAARQAVAQTQTQPTPQLQRSYQAETAPRQNVPRPTPIPADREEENAGTPQQPVSSAKSQPAVDEKPKYKKTSASPSSGESESITFVLDLCHHAGEKINCYGIMKNNAEISQTVNLLNSEAIDDQGRSIRIEPFWGNFRFDTGGRQKLIPGVPVRFAISIEDPYPSVKTLTLELAIGVGMSGQSYHMLFKDYPVQ